MLHLVTLLAVIFAIESIIRFGVFNIVKDVVSTANKSRHVLLSKRISDHWKELTLPIYSLNMILSCLKLIGVLLLILIAFYLVHLSEQSFFAFAISWQGLLEVCVFAVLYLKVRELAVRK